MHRNMVAIGTTGVGIFNITNNREQNQAQEKQDVPISPKPNMSLPLLYHQLNGGNHWKRLNKRGG